MDDESVARRAVTLLDLTELGDRATDDDVLALCSRAVTPHGTVAAVCVWPRHVTLAVRSLEASAVRVATVVNFPSGDEPLPSIMTLTERALADGADEIDLVLPYHAFQQGDLQHVALVLESVRGAVPNDGHLLKVILETGELGDGRTVHAAAHTAVEHGADFIKTSTGKTPTSATLEATAVMLDVICEASWAVGIKPSGGIRTVADARAYIEQADGVMGDGWATPDTFRFGASGLLDALLAVIGGDSEARGHGDY